MTPFERAARRSRSRGRENCDVNFVQHYVRRFDALVLLDYFETWRS